jgi:Ca2+-binding EF-hand superfamily protein
VRALLSILLFSAIAVPAAAQQASSGREKIFIAPSGEPFRVAADQPYPVAKWFAGADKNGDGKLDFTEFDADFMRFFAQLDTNHDGAIDGAERMRYENEVAPETLGGEWAAAIAEAQDEQDRTPDFGTDNDQGASTVQRAKPRYGSHPVGAARFDLLGLPEPVASMDTELRGRISTRVAEEAARQRFDVLDESHRGYLTLDALPPSFSEHRKRR